MVLGSKYAHRQLIPNDDPLRPVAILLPLALQTARERNDVALETAAREMMAKHKVEETP
jgi:hypothetical protein